MIIYTRLNGSYRVLFKKVVYELCLKQFEGKKIEFLFEDFIKCLKNRVFDALKTLN